MKWVAAVVTRIGKILAELTVILLVAAQILLVLLSHHAQLL